MNELDFNAYPNDFIPLPEIAKDQLCPVCKSGFHEKARILRKIIDGSIICYRAYCAKPGCNIFLDIKESN